MFGRLYLCPPLQEIGILSFAQGDARLAERFQAGQEPAQWTGVAKVIHNARFFLSR